jgi:hypothetical protein
MPLRRVCLDQDLCAPREIALGHPGDPITTILRMRSWWGVRADGLNPAGAVRHWSPGVARAAGRGWDGWAHNGSLTSAHQGVAVFIGPDVLVTTEGIDAPAVADRTAVQRVALEAGCGA